MQAVGSRPAFRTSLTVSSRGARWSLAAVRPTAQLPGVPDYERSWERRNVRQPGGVQGAPDSPLGSMDSPQQSTRKWWDYAAPTGAVGRPDIQLKPVTIPALGPDSGNGGGSGGSGRGGGGGGGNGDGRGGGRGGNGRGGGGGMQGPTYCFALALLIGGLTAFFRRGSYKSLVFSAAAVVMLLVAASLMHHRSGTLLAMGTSLALAGVMGQRANSSGKVFPAGVVAVVSALMTVGYARALA